MVILKNKQQTNRRTIKSSNLIRKNMVCFSIWHTAATAAVPPSPPPAPLVPIAICYSWLQFRANMIFCCMQVYTLGHARVQICMYVLNTIVIISVYEIKSTDYGKTYHYIRVRELEINFACRLRFWPTWLE